MTARAVAFWAAVVLPFVSLGVLFAGPVTRLDLLLLLALLSANVVALYAGRSYAPSRTATSGPGVVAGGEADDDDGGGGGGGTHTD